MSNAPFASNASPASSISPMSNASHLSSISNPSTIAPESTTPSASSASPIKRAFVFACFAIALFACAMILAATLTMTLATEEAWATSCSKCGSSEIIEEPGDCRHFYYCDKCGNQWVVTNHSFVEVSGQGRPSTCAQAGVTYLICDICGESSSRALPLASHKFSSWTQTKAPTEQAEGEKSRSCSVCGATETMAIAKLAPSKSTSTSDKKSKDKSSSKKTTSETATKTDSETNTETSTTTDTTAETTSNSGTQTDGKTDADTGKKKTSEKKDAKEDAGEKAGENGAPVPATSSSGESDQAAPAKGNEDSGSSLPVVPIGIGILALLAGIGYGAFRFFTGAAAAAAPATAAAAAGTAAAATAAAVPVGSLISWDDRIIVSYLEHSEYGDKLKEEMDGKSIIDLRPATFGDIDSLKEVVNEDTELIVMSVTETFSCDDALTLVDGLRMEATESADSADGAGDNGSEGAGNGTNGTNADGADKINTKIDPCVALVIPEALTDQMARAAELDESDDILTYVIEGTGTNKAILSMIAPLFKSMLEPGELPSHISNVCCILEIPVISDVSTIRFYSKKAIKTVRKLTR